MSFSAWSTRGKRACQGGESLPQIIVILSRDEELVKFPNSEDYNDTFSNNVINRWRSLGRNEGIYNQLLLSFIQRTRIWSSDGLDRSLFTDWQYILHYMSGLRPVRRTLTMIVSQVESLCDSIPIPRANVPRYQHWPGRSPQHRSALYHWLGVLDGSKEKTSKLATVLAHLFLQDAAQVAHSKFTYVAPSPGTSSNALESCFVETSYEKLFLSLYRPMCISAWVNTGSRHEDHLGKDMHLFLDEVLLNMLTQSSELSHRSRASMKAITHTPFCSTCIWNLKPLIFFPCGHGVCERDAWIYSHRVSKYFTLSRFCVCPACGTPVEVLVRLRPLQAGYRVAVFDGGGVFGVVSLCSLQRLGESLPANLHPHQYFDVVLGTSTGKLNYNRYHQPRLTNHPI